MWWSYVTDGGGIGDFTGNNNSFLFEMLKQWCH